MMGGGGAYVGSIQNHRRLRLRTRSARTRLSGRHRHDVSTFIDAIGRTTSSDKRLLPSRRASHRRYRQFASSVRVVRPKDAYFAGCSRVGGSSDDGDPGADPKASTGGAGAGRLRLADSPGGQKYPANDASRWRTKGPVLTERIWDFWVRRSLLRSIRVRRGCPVRSVRLSVLAGRPAEMRDRLRDAKNAIRRSTCADHRGPHGSLRAFPTVAAHSGRRSIDDGLSPRSEFATSTELRSDPHSTPISRIGSKTAKVEREVARCHRTVSSSGDGKIILDRMVRSSDPAFGR